MRAEAKGRVTTRKRWASLGARIEADARRRLVGSPALALAGCGRALAAPLVSGRGSR